MTCGGIPSRPGAVRAEIRGGQIRTVFLLQPQPVKNAFRAIDPEFSIAVSGQIGVAGIESQANVYFQFPIWEGAQLVVVCKVYGLS